MTEIQNLKPTKNYYSLNSNSAIIAIYELLKEPKTDYIFICNNDVELHRLTQNIKFFSKSIDFNIFPSWDCQFYDFTSPKDYIINQRINTLFKILNNNDKKVVFTTVNAIIQKIIPPQYLIDTCLDLKIGIKININDFALKLVNAGYNHASEVTDIGEFAIRGGIIDIFPVGCKHPVRIDCFGDAIENIRQFDPETQISNNKLAELTILPLSEIIINTQTKENFLDNYTKLFNISQISDDQLYNAVLEDRKYIGLSHWQPLFYEEMTHIFDYLEQPQIILFPNVEEQIFTNISKIYELYNDRVEYNKSISYAEKTYNPLPPQYLYYDEANIIKKFADYNIIKFIPFNGLMENNDDKIYDIETITNFYKRALESQTPSLDLFNNFIKANKDKKMIIACISNGSTQRVKHILDQYNLQSEIITDYADATKDKIALTILNLEHGFSYKDIVIITEEDLFGEKLVTKSLKKSKSSNKLIQEASNLKAGEYVVHIDYGIGRYEGLKILDISGSKHDCLEITYADNDKLYIPVENLELITKYGDVDGQIRLDKLSSNSWQLRKANLKKKIKVAAEKLIHIAAERKLITAPKFIADSKTYDEFCARFPYVETEDQISAINDIEEDLASGNLMDRLICGDVGFGKTEVAMRAAFIILSNNNENVRNQIAIITPTTLLCRQHYNNFINRFKGFNFNIKQLSRLVSAKQAKETKEAIRNGEVDLVIGTHALLSNNISFKNLKFVIIDEEQHFGVKQKEKLKELQSDIHVLSLSATPIPRTLQMSLAGARSLSLITTPPVDRLAVRTYVMPYDPIIIREAILREYSRGGSSFVVCHFIRDLEILYNRLKTLIPEVKIVIAHGQMKANELEDIINRFYERKFDVLLSTTIIESGLDIPTANTIIIHNADDFGLSQLYQLRGRVGRSKSRGYAYLTYSPKKALTEAASKRLEVMSKCDTLGSGFSIATSDMDIRGFGNVMGEEQSGNIREVGIELYQSMLDEAVNELQNSGKDFSQHDWTTQINVNLPVYIPDEYIHDLQLRMSMYRRISLLQNEHEINSFIIELVDRFGSAPAPVHNLLEIMEIKIACKKLNIDKIDSGIKGILVSFRDNKFAHPEKLVNFLNKNKHIAKLRPDQRLFFAKNLVNSDKILQSIKEVIDIICNL